MKQGFYQGNKAMQEILRILKKYKLLIYGGLGVVFFLSILDPIVEFILPVGRPAHKPIIDNNPHWQRFTNFQCEYVVSFPTRPFKLPSPFTNNPHVVLYQQFASMLGSNEAFMMTTLQSSYTNNLSKEQIKFLLDETMADGMEKGDTLIYKHDITYGTNAGRELEIQKTNNDFLSGRYYRIGRYLQMLIVTVPPQEKDSTNISYFFDSFSRIEKQPN